MRTTDGQNCDSQDRASIAESCGKNDNNGDDDDDDYYYYYYYYYDYYYKKSRTCEYKTECKYLRMRVITTTNKATV